MTSEPGQGVTYFSRLDADECWALLAEAEVGRVAWAHAGGILVIPANYRIHDRTIEFQTTEGGALSRLVEPTVVAFEVDEIDAETAMGWSVLIQGQSGPAAVDSDERVSWLDGEWPVWVAITPGQISGRVVSGTKRGGK